MDIISETKKINKELTQKYVDNLVVEETYKIDCDNCLTLDEVEANKQEIESKGYTNIIITSDDYTNSLEMIGYKNALIKGKAKEKRYKEYYNNKFFQTLYKIATANGYKRVKEKNFRLYKEIGFDYLNMSDDNLKRYFDNAFDKE